MKLKKILFILPFLFLFIAACTQPSAGKNIFEWGITKDALIKMERANGNKSFNEKDLQNQINVEYAGMSIYGEEAKVEYIFKKEIKNQSMTLEDNLEKINKIPKSIQLQNYGLVEVNHFFLDISKKDQKKIYKSLVSEYGTPAQTDSKSYFWEVDDKIVYFDGKDYVSYKAKLSSLKDESDA